ncbi:MAG: M48 family metalloprotease [Deltaproteobacteria bacterium]|nr:M48 family metalloprotease [Deltaproteobacteria bacterium]
MYQTIIFYLIVILIYTARPDRPPELVDPLTSLLLIGAIFLAFSWFVRHRCRKLARAAAFHDDGRLPLLYDRLQFQLQIAAIVVFAGMVYGADLGALVGYLPLIGRSEGLNSLVGLTVFFLLEIRVWAELHKAFAGRIVLLHPRSAFIRSRLRFAIGLIAPWLVILVLADVAGALLPARLERLLSQPLGEGLVFLAFLLVLVVAAPPLLVHLWRCRRMPDSPLRSAIEKLCRHQKVGYREIMLWTPFEGRMATAAVIGAFPFTRYLLLTPDLLRLLDGDEVIAVMSHELGHVRYRHLLYFLLFFFTFFIFNYLYYDLAVAWLLTTGPAIRLLESGGSTPEVFLSLLETVPLLLLYLVFFRFVFGFFLRNFERQADLACLELPGLAWRLVSAFEKLGWLLGAVGEKPNWHHYNIPQRINFLKAAINNPEVARRHHRRIKQAILAYLLIFALISIPGIGWQRSGLAEKLHCRYLCQRLERLAREKPDTAAIELALGSLYIECGNEEKAYRHLNRALDLDPANPETLNNLAWLLLTAEKASLRDYPRALKLAEKAAALSPRPHILDTLAEARWRSGDCKAAIELERRALEKLPADEKREHYLEQLEKFASPPPAEIGI